MGTRTSSSTNSLVSLALSESDYQTTCPWKGRASYYTVVVDGKENPDAAWYYPAPSTAAAKIENHVAFWKGVRVER